MSETVCSGPKQCPELAKTLEEVDSRGAKIIEALTKRACGGRACLAELVKKDMGEPTLVPVFSFELTEEGE